MEVRQLPEQIRLGSQKKQLDRALADTLTRLEAERSWISEKSVGRQIFSK